MTGAERKPRFRPRLVTAAIALAGLAVLIGLGAWQLERRDWKAALIAERAAALGAPALTAWDGAAPFRRIRLSGTLLNDREIAVGAQRRSIVPLGLDDGSTVLVDRGPSPPGAAGAGPERVSILGVLVESERGGWFTPENDPAKGEWFTVDVTAIGAALGLERVRPWIVRLGAIADLPNDHLRYAITWFSLALALVVIYGMSHTSREP